MNVDAVVKLGGSAFREPKGFDRAIAAIEAASRIRNLLVVPGGGPFADAVREVDRTVGLSDDASHWMAIRAMDQSAQVVAERLAGAVIVKGREAIAWSVRERKVPVLAPSAMLEAADPLPHSWDVTSDSVAAWVAGQLGVKRLVLIKPAGVGPAGVDAYFKHAQPGDLDWIVLPLNRVAALGVEVAKASGPRPATGREPSAPEPSRS